MKARNIFWMITTPFSTVLGYLLLTKRKKEQTEPVDWRLTIKGRKVLIVGSGPSLDKTPDSYFSNFDVIIYLNHAVKISGKNINEYFFSTDIGVVRDILNKDYALNIAKFGIHRSIIAPIFFQQFVFIPTEIKENFFFIKASSVFIKIHWSLKLKKILIPVTFYLWPRQINADLYEKWFSSDSQLDFFPVIETTSALSAILFCAKYKPCSINLIGCDFSAGRSSVLASDNPGTATNNFSASVEKFNFLKAKIEHDGIKVVNDSWF